MRIYPVKFYIVLIGVCTFLVCCKKQLPVDELEKYLINTENGTKKSFESQNLKVDIIYRPTDLLVKQESASGVKDIDAIRKNYNQYEYFVLNMKYNNADLLNSTASNKQLFMAINNQLAFNLNENIFIIDNNKDTCYLSDFAFPRLFEASKSTSVLLAFKKEDIKTNKFKICLNDLVNIAGSMIFEFDKKDLENIPSLK